MNENTWLISDTHFGHKNIIKYCDRPVNHNEIIIENWINLVDEDDEILHLGDLTVWYGDDQRYWEDRAKELPGKKSLIIGNHDKRKPSVYKKLGFSIVKPFNWQGIHFSHYPALLPMPGVHTNIHGHVHNNNHRVVRRLDGIVMVNVSIEVMHYAPIRLGKVLEVLKERNSEEGT